MGNKFETRDSYKWLAKTDSARNNFQEAFKKYKKYILYRDSMVNEESTRKNMQLKLQYEFDKKEDSLKQKHLLTDTKLQAQKKQKYFYWTGLAMLGMLSIFVFLNFRNQKKINKLAGETHARQKTEMELQSQQAILSERLRISSELHDEVGATLSGIAMYSHLTKEQMKTGQMTEIEKSLNVMQQSSAQMVDKLNDIVWLINPEQDSLQKLVTRLEEYATDMAAIKNMKVKITVPDKIAEINLPIDSRRNIYLFCKEAINNAVKYSNGSLLELTVMKVDNKLEFSVSDNGKGFDAVMVRRGNGLENMQKRADEIGAKLTLQSKLNEGASLSLQSKIT
jgi:signal transduction histidine kinase